MRRVRKTAFSREFGASHSIFLFSDVFAGSALSAVRIQVDDDTCDQSTSEIRAVGGDDIEKRVQQVHQGERAHPEGVAGGFLSCKTTIGLKSRTEHPANEKNLTLMAENLPIARAKMLFSGLSDVIRMDGVCIRKLVGIDRSVVLLSK